MISKRKARQRIMRIPLAGEDCDRLQQAAFRRGETTEQMLGLLIRIVVRDRLITAVLDGEQAEVTQVSEVA